MDARFEPRDLAEAALTFWSSGDFDLWIMVPRGDNENIRFLTRLEASVNEDVLDRVEQFVNGPMRQVIGEACYEYVYGEEPDWGAKPADEEMKS